MFAIPKDISSTRSESTLATTALAAPPLCVGHNMVIGGQLEACQGAPLPYLRTRRERPAAILVDHVVDAPVARIPQLTD